MRYAFTPPAGWSRAPFPPPQRGIYLRAPVPSPSAESASILLFEEVAPAGSLEQQLGKIVDDSCQGVKVGKTGKPTPVKTRSFPALAQSLSVTVAGPPKHDELRVFVLVEVGGTRLPIAFIGGAKSLPAHQAALDGLLASIGELQIAAGLYTRFVE
jgi:hypothetical protein